MEQKSCLKLIYKINSSKLRKSNWNLNLPLDVAMRDCPELIVSLNDSQALRFIDEINGVEDLNGKVKAIQSKIKREKKKPKSRETKALIKGLYEKLYSLQFQKDYVCVIMDTNKDYDRANKGFAINGIKYRRFLGTSGSIKKSTIVYVNVEIYDELKRRLDNGRNMNVPLVPAKLEAYQALICSGSTPVPEPNGIIVVKDCMTFFKEDVIMIDDAEDGEPVMTEVKDYEFEHDDSDGYGLMLPSYASRVNQYLSGNDEPLSGMNTRLSFEKGCVFTFDFIEFAEKVAGTYEITDVWGHKRDVRNAEVILTESMLKLWNCYDSWEDCWRNCKENHYQFSVPKVAPDKLESVRTSNYQFLQPYDFTDDELRELCQPTIDEIKGVLGLDWRKSIVYLAGFGLNEENAFKGDYDYCVKALMIDKRMINDPFIRRRIWNMIQKKIEAAKRGAIKLNANYALISGDPYALCQSMFGLEITGLLKAGEVYHKYWIDKGAEEIAMFRAPMLDISNVRKAKLNSGEVCSHWYQYMKTVLINNAFDSTCDAMCGSDKDGDTNMTTDNEIIVRNTNNEKTIVCVQHKAEKKIPTEEDIIAANKIAFNDDIGTITNHATSMVNVRAAFPKDSLEYKTLTYRIKASQKFQQDSIDRSKGIISKPMPPYWYNARDNVIRDGDDEETVERKKFNMKIVAANKPYFMTYIYPELRKKARDYFKNNDSSVRRRFGEYGLMSVEDVKKFDFKTEEMKEFIYNYDKYLPVGMNDCVVNRICRIFESEFDGYISKRLPKSDFDHTILKSNVGYSKYAFNQIKPIYDKYWYEMKKFFSKSAYERAKYGFEYNDIYHRFSALFRMECEKVCSNEDELCDIVVDLSYGSDKAKQFAWDVCGDKILSNLLNTNLGRIHIPVHIDGAGEFEYCGEQFEMREVEVGGINDDYTE